MARTGLLIFIGVVMALAIWVVQRHKLSRGVRIGVLVGLVVLLLSSAILFWSEGVFLSAKAWYDESPWRELIFLALMTAGMAARYLAGAIEERRDRIAKLIAAGKNAPQIPLRFDAWEFSYPLLFSVVTFGGLLGQIREDGVVLTNVILSFQTGFFWQTLLKRELRERGVATEFDAGAKTRP